MGKRDKREPNLIVKFDGKEYSEEEQSFLISRLIQVLSRMDMEQKRSRQK